MHKGPTLKDRLILYPAIAVIFLFICYVVALSAWGFRFYLEDGKIIRRETGMIIVATKPGNADVYLDGKKQKKATPAFSFLSLTVKNVPIGSHNLRVVKDGYESWEGTRNVESGLVAWANYLILVPQKRTASNYSFPGTVVQTIQSPDKNKVFVLAEDATTSLRTIWEVNLQNKDRKKIKEEAITSGKKVALSSSTIDGNRLLLIRSDEASGKYVVVESKLGGAEWPIDELFGTSFKEIKFSADSNLELIALKGNDLHLIEYESKKMSAVMATNVIGFYPEPSGLFAVEVRDNNYGLYKLNKSGTGNNIIKSVPASDSYQFEYLDKSGGYIILPSKTGEALYYHTDKSGRMITGVLNKNSKWFSLSPVEENVAVYGDKSLVVYNFEKDETFTTIKDKEISSFSWFNDQSNIVYTEGAKINLVNFDGNYDKFLFDTAPESSVYATAGSANIYFLTKNKELKDLSVFSFNF